MTSQYRLSLKEAIFVNINVMIGVGIFVNTIPLVVRIGIFSPLSYLIVGVLLLPLIFSIMKLLSYYPEGGFYTYVSSELSTTLGFAAAWSYFIGKMASATLVLSISTFLFRQLIPGLVMVDVKILYVVFLGIILFINSMGMKFGSFLQKILVYAKFLPILIIIGVGFMYFFYVDFSLFHYEFKEIIGTIPMVLYAASGFETACILSLTIQDPARNASRAILFSYIAVLSVAAIYQFFAYIVLSGSIGVITEYHQLFNLVAASFKNPQLVGFVQLLLYAGVAYSGFGSALGMFYGNIWNFFTLAQHKHLPVYGQFTRLNRFGIPFLCIIAEAVVSLFFLFISSGNILLLQQCSSLALSLTFTMSVFALFRRHQKNGKSLLLPLLGLVNCLVLITACLYSLVRTSAYAFVLFTCLFVFGISMLLLSERKIEKNN